MWATVLWHAPYSSSASNAYTRRWISAYEIADKEPRPMKDREHQQDAVLACTVEGNKSLLNFPLCKSFHRCKVQYIVEKDVTLIGRSSFYR
jgi:hypothetical protein